MNEIQSQHGPKNDGVMDQTDERKRKMEWGEWWSAKEKLKKKKPKKNSVLKAFSSL